MTRIATLGLILFLTLCASAAQAADSSPVAWTDVGHSWSVWKWVGYAVTVIIAWLVCSRLYFDRLIDHRQAWAVWPRDAFARSMWFFIVIVSVAFVLWFRVALAKRRYGMLPRWGGVGHFVNEYWLLILITLSGLAIASIFHGYNKHSSSHQSPSRAGR